MPSHSRPSLLFLSQCLPYPPDGGVKIRTYHTLRLLSTLFDVTALCFYRWKSGAFDDDVPRSVEALAGFGHVEAFPIPQEHSRARFAWDHFRSVTTGRVYTRYAYDSSPFRTRLARALRERHVDLVHADSLDLAAYFPGLGDRPIVCVHHDAQSVLLGRRAAQERSSFRRAYVALQASLMAREERIWCSRVALNVTVSEGDREALQARAPSGQFLVVPNGVDVETFQPAVTDERGLVFVGGATWFPNLDAMHYFAAEILPRLRVEVPDIRLTWVGRLPEAQRRVFGRDLGIEATGYVPDIRPYVHRATCYVVPIRVGGGTRIKILDAWAMGKAVVSTSVGCEGLAARDGVNILIRDTPAEFAAAVIEVLHNTPLRTRLGVAARKTVEERYSWDVIGKSMLESYRALLISREHPRQSD